MKLVNDTPCPNCGKTDGAPDRAVAREEADGYSPGGTTTYFACSRCVVELQARLDVLYPPSGGVARVVL